jgi:hypothetical protein
MHIFNSVLEIHDNRKFITIQGSQCSILMPLAYQRLGASVKLKL